MKYAVTVNVIVQKEIVVQADSAHEAESKATEAVSQSWTGPATSSIEAVSAEELT